MKAAQLANIVLLGAAAAALAVVIRSTLLLRALWRHQVEASVLMQTTLVCGGFVLVAGLLLAGLRLRPALRVNAALAVAALLTALYLAEGREALDDPIARRLGERASLIESLNRQGIRAYGGIEPVRFIWSRESASPNGISLDGRHALPLAGISRRTTVDCKEGDEAPWLVFETDERGFRNPPGLWGRAPVELAAVGDSFTAGSCVPSAQNMLERIRERYPTALNLGMAGSGPLLMLAEVREYLPAVRPRIVLWCHYGGNDLRDLPREWPHPILARYLEDGFRQHLAERQGAVDAALDEYDQSWLSKRAARLAHHSMSLSAILSLSATRYRMGLAFPDPDTFAPTEAEFRLFETILGKARSTVASWNGRLVFAYLPAWSGPPRQVGEQGIRELEARTRRRVLGITERLGLPVIDVGAAFAAHADPDSLFACPGCHYGPAGYRLAAETILGGLGVDALAR